MSNAANGGPRAGAAALELVVAVAENDVIGRGNQLPWHLPADLRHFKSLTLGKSVLMGRKTYESIGKALPGRKNIVLSRSADFSPGDCTVVTTLEAARAAATGGVGLDGDRGGGDLSAMSAAGGAHSSHSVARPNRRRHDLCGLAWGGVGCFVTRTP
jgi:hypothetical protein